LLVVEQREKTCLRGPRDQNRKDCSHGKPASKAAKRGTVLCWEHSVDPNIKKRRAKGKRRRGVSRVRTRLGEKNPRSVR